MKRVIVGLMGLLMVCSACTPQQVATWKQWHRSDPEAATAFLDTPEYTELSTSADVTAQAERTNPPDPQPEEPTDSGSGSSANRRCVGYEGLLARYSPGWDVVRMSRIMYRESRCNPGAHNSSGATGLLQILRSHCGWLSSRVGSCNLTNASYNIRAAAELWRNGGYAHWSTR